jgi:serine/threonine protein kinase
MPTIHNQANDSGLHLRIPRIGGYTLLEPLADGSSCLLYRARQDRVGRMVALKLLPEWPPATDVALERFNRAAYVTAQVQHPNLLTLFDFGTVDGYHFASMELASGQTLQKHLAQNGPMDEDAALKLAEQLLGALNALHSRDICHRNIKPKNILIESNGNARLIGLGLASCKSAFFSPHLDARPIGTPHFMAPEMIRGSFADPRSDLYSIGVTLFVATTGRTPFDKGTPMAVMSRRLTETPMSLAEARPTLSKSFCGFVDTLMARDAERRFQSSKSALDICQALRAEHTARHPQHGNDSSQRVLVQMRAYVPPRESLRKRLGRWMHNPVLVVLASAMATVLLLGGMTLGLRKWSSDNARPSRAPYSSVSPASDMGTGSSLTREQREILRLSRLEQIFDTQPMMGVESWTQFLKEFPAAPDDVKDLARTRLNFYTRLTNNDAIQPARREQPRNPTQPLREDQF